MLPDRFRKAFGVIAKPEILAMPNIPKPLHGIAPREIMGKEWWNAERQRVYASTNYHCIACGVEKTKAKKHQWLEAHEFWHINYQTGICTIASIEPLCHYCHNFIHSGRLSLIVGTEKSEEEAKEILEHGFKILGKHGLKCFPFTLEFGISLGCNTHGVKPYKLKVNPNLKGSDWKLIWNGAEYKSKFNSFEERQAYYNNENARL